MDYIGISPSALDSGKTWISLSQTGVAHIGAPMISKTIGDIMAGVHPRQITFREKGDYLIEVEVAYQQKLDITLNRYSTLLPTSADFDSSSLNMVVTKFTFIVRAQRGDVATFSSEPAGISIKPYKPFEEHWSS